LLREQKQKAMNEVLELRKQVEEIKKEDQEKERRITALRKQTAQAVQELDELRVETQGKKREEQEKKKKEELGRTEKVKKMIEQELKKREAEKLQAEERHKQTERDLLAAKQQLRDLQREVVYLRMPRWFLFAHGYHLADTCYARGFLQIFLQDSAHCSSTKRARIIRTKRVENEHLWKMYQTTKAAVKSKIGKLPGIPDLAPFTEQPLLESADCLDRRVNEFYL
jgi:hypothetical protein